MLTAIGVLYSAKKPIQVIFGLLIVLTQNYMPQLVD